MGVSVRVLIKTRTRLTACLAQVPPEAQVLPGLLALPFRSDTNQSILKDPALRVSPDLGASDRT